jgi:hypothetical protein
MTKKDESTQSPAANGPGQFPAPPLEPKNHTVLNPDRPADPIEGEAGDGLNQETGDNTND